MNSENLETEATIYAKILNPDGLKQASSVEHHLQIEGRYSKGNVRCRVRRTTKPGQDPVYVHTLKYPQGKSGTIARNKEINITVDEEFCEAFIMASEKYLVKTRYIFKYPDLDLKVNIDGTTHIVSFPEIVYEVDIFKREDGEISQYCKIDVELDNAYKFLIEKFPDAKVMEIILKVSHLPINPSEKVMSKDPSPYAQKFMNDLWENEFNRRYKHE